MRQTGDRTVSVMFSEKREGIPRLTLARSDAIVSNDRRYRFLIWMLVDR